MLSKPFSPKALLSLSSSSSTQLRSSVLVSHFSTSSSPSHHSSSYVESRNVRVSVWWDFENCHVPVGVNVHRVAQTISAAVRSSGIKGPIQITAFGDVQQISRANQEALSSTGISLTHIPAGGKNSADRSLLVDLMYWVSQNPPPAHLFLISGDRDFASVLHRLRMNNYNILLASTGTAHSVLCSAASIMWNWHALVKGENLTGRHINQPPDGPYGSWYGHYKMPLEDPFPVIEQSISSRGHSSSESGSEPTTRQIPNRVMHQISNILSLNPEGISITRLRSELAKSNVDLDKDLFGYKKFSTFLFSMSHILKLKPVGDGQFTVYRNIGKAPEQLELSPYMPNDSDTDNEKQQLNQHSKSNGEDTCTSGSRDGKLSLPSPPELKVAPSEAVNQPPCPAEKDAKEYVQQSPTKMDQPSPTRETAVEVVNPVTKDCLSRVKEQNSSSEIDVSKKIKRLWYGSETASHIPKETFTATDSSDVKNERTLEKCSDGDISGKKGVKEMKSPIQDNGQVLPGSCVSSNANASLKERSALISEACQEKPMKIPGFFERIFNWFKLWSNGSNNNATDVLPSDVLKQQDKFSGKLDIFSEDTFWRDIESFIDSKVASDIILRSSTRKDMAENLQKGGPLFLRSLDASNVLQLVDMLISEKKLVEEHPSEAFPFRLTRPAQVDTPDGGSQTSNGLSSIFMNSQSQSELSGLDEDKRMPNISDAGVSDKKPPERSRSEILADCQNLVNEVLKDYPKGYNLATFRKLFRDRYGYRLDIKRLGYQNLVSLIQIMPGVKIESNHIFPSVTSSKHSSQDLERCTDSSRKEDDFDSSWEELGPVEGTGSGGRIPQSLSSRRKPEKETQNNAYHYYEPAVSDDDFLESDGESLTASRPSDQAKQRVNGEGSLFLEILNSWSPDSSKEGGHKSEKPENAENAEVIQRQDSSGQGTRIESLGNPEKPENAEVMVDISASAIQRQDSSGQGTRTESLGNHAQKQRHKKSYSFVADPIEDNTEKMERDKLLDGIIGSLKKSGESRMEN